MKIWIAEFSPNVYFGAFCVLALYAEKEDAMKHIEKHERKISKDYKDGIPTWMKWRVRKMYVRFGEARL